MTDPIIFGLGIMVTMIFSCGVGLMVFESRRSAQANRLRAARLAIYAKPRVIDIDSKEETIESS